MRKHVQIVTHVLVVEMYAEIVIRFLRNQLPKNRTKNGNRSRIEPKNTK